MVADGSRRAAAAWLALWRDYFLEGAIVGVAATLLAPFLAAAVTAARPDADLRAGDGRRAAAGDGSALEPRHAGGAAGGAGADAARLRRRATQRRGQPARTGAADASLFHRYYLDLVVVAFAGLLLWEIERGSVFQPSNSGIASDPPLAAPALIIVAAALLVLRFYPLLLRWVSPSSRGWPG
jgi:hypothetical protein